MKIYGGETIIYPAYVWDGEFCRLACNSCGKAVSSPFRPQSTDTPDGGLVVRAWIECPECMEKDGENQNQLSSDGPQTHGGATGNTPSGKG
jgi:hypothetical protein